MHRLLLARLVAFALVALVAVCGCRAKGEPTPAGQAASSVPTEPPPELIPGASATVAPRPVDTPASKIAAPSPAPLPGGGAFASADELARTLFESVKANDEAKYTGCFATDFDVRYFGDQAGAARGALEKRLQDDVAKAKAGFAKLRAQPGVKWEEARLDRVDARTGKSEGIEGGDVTVVFVTGGQSRKLLVNNAMRSSRGWVAAGQLKLRE